MTAKENTQKANPWAKRLLFLMVSGAVGAIAVLFLWKSDPSIANWKARLEGTLAFLDAQPWALILAVATLPSIGFPLSPLLLFFGIALAPKFGMPVTCLLGICAQSVCTTWTYLLASSPLREALRKIISQHRQLPETSEENMVKICVILRITPGIPYSLQNIV